MTLTTDLAWALRSDRVGLNRVDVGNSALTRLGALLVEQGDIGSVVLLVDEKRYTAADGSDVKTVVGDQLSGIASVTTVKLHGEVHADETTVRIAVDGCAGADVVVTVGSGTLCDIGKVAAGDRTHIVVQTAASVNGFADDQSVLLINNVKRTTHSGWPRALVIDSGVLEGAPRDLNRSGLGDMVSMFTAPADWYLSSIVGMDRGWDITHATMTRRYGNDLLSISAGVGRSDPDALSALAKFLTLSGISMGVAGQTSPSSGMEHTVSHLMDMAKGSHGEHTALHGAQVGTTTVIVATLWRRMLARIADGTLGAFVLPSSHEAETRVRDAFDWMDSTGATSDECWADYSKKLVHLRENGAADRIASTVASWSEHAEVLESLLESPERIAVSLASAGAPVRISDVTGGCSSTDSRWALTNCHLMRNRFTIADLAFFTGWWTEVEVESVLDEAKAFGAGL